MKITRKDLSKSEVQLTVEATSDEFKEYRRRSLQKIGQQVKIDGFRKGHIPEKILVDHVGEQAILSEAIDKAIPDLLNKAIISEKLNMITQPKVEVKTVDPFVFEAIIALFPEVELGKDWEKVKIKKNKTDVTKKEIKETIENLQKKFVERKPVDRKAKKDDFVEIDFSGKDKDGVVLEGTVSKRHPMIIGLGTFIPGFEDELIGMKKGEEKSFEIIFPKDYRAEHLQGKPVIFDVVMHDVQEQILPEWNEELVEKIFGKKMDPKEAEGEIEKILQEKKNDEERVRRENELIESWEKKAKVELPAVLIDEEVENMVNNIKHQAHQAQMTWEQYLANMKKTEEEVKKEMRPDAETRCKQRFVLGKVISESSIEVSEEEIAMELIYNPERDPQTPIEKGNDEWRQSEHRIRVAKLIDNYLEDGAAEKKAKKEEPKENADGSIDVEEVEKKEKKKPEKKKEEK